MTEEFDAWLDARLDASLTPVVASARPPALERVLAGADRLVISFPARPLATRAAVGLAAALLAVAGGGYAVASVANGTPNPTAWGQAVQKQVETCQQQRTSEARGIGECVSTFARQNGEEHRAESHPAPGHTPEGSQPGKGKGENPASPTPEHGKSHATPTPAAPAKGDHGKPSPKGSPESGD